MQSMLTVATTAAVITRHPLVAQDGAAALLESLKSLQAVAFGGEVPD